MKRKALGKGLSALLPEPEPQPADASAEATIEASIDSLEPNPHQPRGPLDPGRLSELAASIRESGMVQPIVVRRTGSTLQIIAGERRWRAARQAGLTRVPVAVREVPDEKLLELALVENIQREELNPIEEAQALQRLQRDLGLSQDGLAQKVGRDRSTVANALRLLRLPPEIRELLSQGRLDAGHGRALLAIDDAETQKATAREAARLGLSVREVERRVAGLRASRPPEKRRVDANTRAAEERLRGSLGARVEIRRRGRAGVIVIRFGSETELQRLFEQLVASGQPRARVRPVGE
jgi:ParB family transcriptional regulator, chromosome partitioning protein